MDAHVHFHSLRRVGATLDAAAANFRAAMPGRAGLLGCLLLTQGGRERVFEQLLERRAVGEWRLAPAVGEPVTLLAARNDDRLAIVCGRQVRAADGLEVAALGTLQEFVDGRPFDASLDAVIASGAVTVIPWGFGKWTGRRRARVGAVLGRTASAPLFLGDSGSRTWLLGEPSLLREARASGLRVLAGSDAFPFAADHRRVGEFGFLAGVEPDSVAPWGSVRAWLDASAGTPPLYGRPSGPIRFLINQFGAQLHGRLSRSRPA